MPVNPTYPGVYIQEIPSGVRTITGVATSITAFAGKAPRGSVNKAVQILSLRDYETRFGGLSEDSDMSYAVNQFFLNGGTEAWVVRLAKNAKSASLDVQGSSITITGLDEGEDGNNIQVLINDPSTDKTIDQGRFNLTLSYLPPGNPANNKIETYKGLSIDPRDPRYILDVVNGDSQLVVVSVGGKLTTPTTGLQPGKLITGAFGPHDLDTLPDATHNSFKIGFNGKPAETTVTLDNATAVGNNLGEKLSDIASRILQKVRSLKANLPAWRDFTCTVSSDKTALVFASGTIGSGSSVEVADSASDSIFAQLHLDHATIEPGSIPDPPKPLGPQPGKLTSDVFGATDLDTFPDGPSFRIGFDGNPANTVITIDKAPATGSNLLDKLADVASRIQKAARSQNAGSTAWSQSTCTVLPDNSVNPPTTGKLVLASGTIGANSSVEVADLDPNHPAQLHSIFAQLHLDRATVTVPGNPALAGGVADTFDLDTGVEEMFPTDGSHKGIFAFDEVDLINLLCLPGVTNPTILNNAIDYCKKRRALMIIDPDPNLDRTGMINFITGQNLPKADLGTYAAIYFPQVKAPDLLNGGKLRLFPPSGTIAGLYARTDGTRGVWKAPAGTEASLIGVRGLDVVLTDEENGSLNPLGVNCLRNFRVIGSVCWGARTVSGADQIASEYKYVPVRRTALYIEESLYRGTQWVVFEPNDEPLWAQIRLNIGAFMHDLFRKGAFQGKTPREAYFVKCDSDTTTQNDIDHGIVNIIVGFAPLKPAEFVIISIQQIAGQLQV